MMHTARITIIRYVALFIIVIMFFAFISFGINGFRIMAYQGFQKGATLYLDYQTRELQTMAGRSFILKYTEGDQENAPFILETISTYYSELLSLLGDAGYKKQPTLIVLYPDATSLNASLGWSGLQRADGVYWAGSIRLLSPQVYLPEGQDPQLLRAAYKEKAPLVHELTHQVLDCQTQGNYTRWFTEGLAQFMEKKMIGYQMQEPDLIDQAKLYSLAEIDKHFDQPATQTLVYWQSLVTVTYLIEEYGWATLKSFITLLGQGKNFSRAFYQAYGFELLDLQEKVEYH